MGSGNHKSRFVFFPIGQRTRKVQGRGSLPSTWVAQVQGHRRQQGCAGTSSAGPGTPSCRHTWTPQPSRPLLTRPGSSSGSPRAGYRAGRARSLGRGSPRETEKVPPPRRRRPGAPLAPLAPHAPHAPQPPGRAQGRRAAGAQSPGTVAGAGGTRAAPLQPLGARDRPRGAQPVLTTPRTIPRWRRRRAPRAGTGAGWRRGGESEDRERRRRRRGRSGEQRGGGACTRCAARAARQSHCASWAAAAAGALSPPAPPPPLPAAPAPGPPRPAFPPPPLCASGPQRPSARTPGRPHSGRGLADAAPKDSTSWGCARNAPGDAPSPGCGASPRRAARGSPGSGCVWGQGGTQGLAARPGDAGRSSWPPPGGDTGGKGLPRDRAHRSG